MNRVSVLKYASQSREDVTIEALFQRQTNILENLADKLTRKHTEDEFWKLGSVTSNAH